MALNITTSTIDGVIVVYCGGFLVFGEESTSLRMLVKDLYINWGSKLRLYLVGESLCSFAVQPEFAFASA